ncbi:MAG: DinB family protein [Acidimicrobiales bacterium]
MWVDPDDDPREAGTSGTDERSILLDYLRRYRLTMQMKCVDLNAEQLARRSVPPSTMSLLGLVRHMAEVERGWFRRFMAAQDVGKLFCTTESPDEDWDGAIADEAVVTEAWRAWREEVAFAEEYVAGTSDLGTLGTRRDGTTAPLRDILVHMVEEYARHCGHADLLRECIDGRVGQ